MKERTFFTIFKGLLMKQITQFFLEGESPTFRFFIFDIGVRRSIDFDSLISICLLRSFESLVALRVLMIACGKCGRESNAFHKSISKAAYLLSFADDFYIIITTEQFSGLKHFRKTA